MGTWKNLGRVNYGSLDVTLIMCQAIGFSPDTAEMGHWNGDAHHRHAHQRIMVPVLLFTFNLDNCFPLTRILFICLHSPHRTARLMFPSPRFHPLRIAFPSCRATLSSRGSLGLESCSNFRQFGLSRSPPILDSSPTAHLSLLVSSFGLYFLSAIPSSTLPDCRTHPLMFHPFPTHDTLPGPR